MVETSLTSIQPRCRKCGQELGPSYLYSTDGFTYHHECFPLSPTQAQLSDLQRQLSEAIERAEKAEGWARDWHGIVDTICVVLGLGSIDAQDAAAAVRAKFEQAERERDEAREQRDDYLNRGFLADLDKQAAIDRHAELVEALEAGEAFGFDPATGFAHADDGGAPETCVFYVPKASTTAAEAEVARLRETITDAITSLDLGLPFYDEEFRDLPVMTNLRAALQGEPS